MYTGVSNLATSLQMARANGQAKLAMQQAGQEVASGKKADLVEATKGDFGPLFALERGLSQQKLRAQTIQHAAAKSAATQLNMAQIEDTLSAFGTELLGAIGLGNQAQAFTIANAARGGLDSMVSALNAQYGGQSLFAGAHVDQPAMIDSQSLYADISALTLAAPDSATVITIIDDYFMDPAGGFMGTAFTGSALNAPSAELAPGEVVNFSIRGDDLAIRRALRDVALVAIAAKGDHGGTALDGMNIMEAAANGVLGTQSDLTGLRESLGHIEGQIEAAGVRNTAQTTTYEINRNAIIAADPYEAATRFQALEGQMEAIYLMTSRLSNLRLQNYLR